MRAHLSERLELGRVVNYFGPDEGQNGRFVLQGPCGCKLHIISVDGKETGWEQVSVSTERRRSPNWLEMCFVKDLFWDEEECVVQFHPPLSQYVKNNRYCLHLWKPRHAAIPQPPSALIGIVGLDPEDSHVLAAAILGGTAGLDPEQVKLYFETVLPAVAKLETTQARLLVEELTSSPPIRVS
jgi:hypothetical protein